MLTPLSARKDPKPARSSRADEAAIMTFPKGAAGARAAGGSSRPLLRNPDSQSVAEPADSYARSHLRLGSAPSSRTCPHPVTQMRHTLPLDDLRIRQFDLRQVAEVS